MTIKIVKRLLAIAQVSFDFNHRAGRRGKEWDIGSEVTYQAAKRIEELEKALEPFARYGDIALDGYRKDYPVVAVYGYNSKGEDDYCQLKARHFHKAQSLLNKK